jgi:hypothetical protein
MSTAYHPQTDGASEQTNKTVNQLLRYHVDRHQKGWHNALPRIEFAINDTKIASTGKSPFELTLGYRPRLLPPTQPNTLQPLDVPAAQAFVDRMHSDIQDARDQLTAAKVRQAHHANQHRGPKRAYAVGDRVMLDTKNRRGAYRVQGKQRSAKLLPRFDGPWTVLKAWPETSTYKLDML